MNHTLVMNVHYSSTNCLHYFRSLDIRYPCAISELFYNKLLKGAIFNNFHAHIKFALYLNQVVNFDYIGMVEIVEEFCLLLGQIGQLLAIWLFLNL
jgi:hypothetical protein